MMTDCKNQRGVSMLFALCALAVLTLGAVALVRSVDTGMLVLGNLGFKKDAVAAGSLGAQAAITWLEGNSGTAVLDKDAPDKGYYATAPSNLDPTGATVSTGTGAIVLVDWDGKGKCDGPGTGSRSSVVCLASFERPVDDNTKVRYVITRLCKFSGANDKDNNCVVPVTSQGEDSEQRGSLGMGGRFEKFLSGTAYRILTRTVGTRGTVAYTETLVHF